MSLRHAEESLPELVPEMAPPAPRVVPKPPPQPSTVENNDLFEAHDFELNIKIDPQPALPGKFAMHNNSLTLIHYN